MQVRSRCTSIARGTRWAALAVFTLAATGCLYIPTTRRLVENGDGHRFSGYGKPRPESLVGRGVDKPIRIGSTRLADALIAVQGSVLPNGWYRHLLQMVTVSRDARVWRVRYPLRVGFFTYTVTEGPYSDVEWRLFTLEADAAGVVVATESATFEPGGFPIPAPSAALPPASRLFAVFNEADREKLRSAGIFPSDAELVE